MVNRLTHTRGWMLTALTAVTLPLLAQDMPKPQWISVVTTHVKPEMRQQYEAYQKELSAAYKKANRPRYVWVEFAGDLTEYASVVPIANLAEFDGDSPVQTALGKDAAADLMRRGSQFITSARREVLVARPDLGLNGEGSPAPVYAVLERTVINAGRNRDYEHWVTAEFNPAMKKGGVASLDVYESIFGGDGDYVMVMPMSKIGMLDAGHPAWKMDGGRAAAEAMFDRLNGIAASGKTMILRFRADLSNLPAASTGGGR